jgi:hypothetical protein
MKKEKWSAVRLTCIRLKDRSRSSAVKGLDATRIVRRTYNDDPPTAPSCACAYVCMQYWYAMMALADRRLKCKWPPKSSSSHSRGRDLPLPVLAAMPLVLLPDATTSARRSSVSPPTPLDEMTHTPFHDHARTRTHTRVSTLLPRARHGLRRDGTCGCGRGCGWPGQPRHGTARARDRRIHTLFTKEANRKAQGKKKRVGRGKKKGGRGDHAIICIIPITMTTTHPPHLPTAGLTRYRGRMLSSLSPSQLAHSAHCHGFDSCILGISQKTTLLLVRVVVPFFLRFRPKGDGMREFCFIHWAQW